MMIWIKSTDTRYSKKTFHKINACGHVFICLSDWLQFVSKINFTKKALHIPRLINQNGPHGDVNSIVVTRMVAALCSHHLSTRGTGGVIGSRAAGAGTSFLAAEAWRGAWIPFLGKHAPVGSGPKPAQTSSMCKAPRQNAECGWTRSVADTDQQGLACTLRPNKIASTAFQDRVRRLQTFFFYTDYRLMLNKK